MSFFEEGAKGFVAAENGIDLVVIVGVVAVIAGRLKNRREV